MCVHKKAYAAILSNAYTLTKKQTSQDKRKYFVYLILSGAKDKGLGMIVQTALIKSTPKL